MKAADGHTTPLWKSGLKTPTYPAPSAGGERAEVIVVGAGIAGLTTAYLLSREGYDVVVLDEGEIGSGQTERTSAHLGSVLDDGFHAVEKLLGETATQIAHASHAAAIDLIEQISRDEKIDCDFARVDAYLFPGKPGDERELEKELDAAKRAGVTDVEWVDSAPTAKTGRALRFGNQGRFHPLKYLYGLAEVCRKRKVTIRTGRRVIDVQGANTSAGMPATVSFAGEQKVTASHVVVATNAPAPINDWAGIYTKQASYRTYMVGLSVDDGAVADALYWDTLDAYHYVRLLREPKDGKDVLLVGGEDHKVGQPGAEETRFANLADWAKQVFPGVGEVVSKWSGQVQEPADGEAFIGRAPTKGENVYVITGDSGMGLTHGTLGAVLVSDLIRGKKNEWETLYDPSRKETNAEWVTENVNTAAQYKDYVTGSDVAAETDIPVGEGAVMRHGLKKIAVYRESEDKVHRMSAVCPHLYGIVHWNPVEKSWDCPCHGSRFDCHGKAVMGPAIDDLPEVD